MRIFLTGATGYIGSGVLDALVRAGHHVTALVRNHGKAARITERGAHPVVGNLAEPESYRAAAAAHDGYVHAALDATIGRAAAVDRTALDMLIAAAKRPRTANASSPARRFIIYTSGVSVLGPTIEPAGEDAPLNPSAHVSWRAEHEQLVLAAATDHLRTIVVRPGYVYGGGEGMGGDLFKAASDWLVGGGRDGNHAWTMV